ncbi:unnamed protein product [Heterobilharzia americana]|nr:unnamed protein product [Heterobilharzia americana]
MAKNASHSNTHTIHIHLLRIVNKEKLNDGSKYSAKLEHGDFSCGETNKVDQNENNELFFDYTFKYDKSFTDMKTIESLCSIPFVLSVFEQKPKDKKQKEIKSELLGQTTFDCLPLVKNVSKFQLSLKLFCSSSATTSGEFPTVEIAVYVDQQLLTDESFENLNIIYLNVESMQNLPETFHSKDHNIFIAALPMFTAVQDAEVPVISSKGCLKSPSDVDYLDCSFKWPNSGTARSFANILQSSLSEDLLSSSKKEDGDYPLSQYPTLRASANSARSKVIWNHQHRCLLNKSSEFKFKEKISVSKVWPVEVFCIPNSSSGRKKKDEELSYSHHGVAYVNLTPLLYPGVSYVRGAYKIHPFNQKEYEERTKRQNGLLQEVLNKVVVQSASTAPTEKKKGQLSVSKPDRKVSMTGAKSTGRTATSVDMEYEPEKQKSNVTLNTVHEQTTADQLQNTDAQQYLDAHSFIILEFRLDKPLIKKRTLEEIDQNISLYIAEKQPVVRRHVTAEKAVKEYHKQIAEVANYLLMEFKVMFADLIQTDQLPVDHECAEQMKLELYYSLNSSGKYFAFKERLKFAVIKIVRERFFRTKPFSDQEQLHERITRDPSSSIYWLDFGVYYLGRNELEQAAICFHRSLTLDSKQSTGLVLFGLVSAMQNFNEEATDFLEAAVAHDPKNPIVWVILGLFYETISNDIGVDMALSEAKRLAEGDDHEVIITPKSDLTDSFLTDKRQSSNILSEGSQNDELINRSSKESTKDEILDEQVDNPRVIINDLDKESNPSILVDGNKTELDRIGDIKTRKSRTLKGQKSGTKIPTGIHCELTTVTSAVGEKPQQMSLFIRTAEFLLERNMFSFASVALAHELIAQKKDLECQSASCDPQIFTSSSVPNLQTQPESHTPIQGQLSNDNHYPANFSTTGLSTLTNRISSTNILFHRVSSYHLLCARLAMSSYKQDLSEAEFNVSLIIEADPESIEAWACLGHLRYTTGDFSAARACYERCLALITWPPKDEHSLLMRLGSIYLQEQKYREAKDIYLRACKHSPTCATWLGVGKACFRLGELENAEEALTEANYINNRNPEVWAYLSMICLKTNRRTEAEQSFKYAIKTKLQDVHLLDEIHALQLEVGWGNPLVYWETYSQQ